VAGELLFFQRFCWHFRFGYDSAVRTLVVLFIHFIANLARLLGPGGARSIIAESLLLKHQLLIVNRSRQRSPNLQASDRILAGLIALWMRPARLFRSAIVWKPSTLLSLHKAMCQRKYRMLFSPKGPGKPGPKGPSSELIRAVVEMKQRNPRWGCPRIAQQIGLAFNLDIDKDVVRRILANNLGPGEHSVGPSWLTFLGHMKDSLWSVDLFRCESATLPHWVLVVMDQFTRRIIGFGVHAGTVDGAALCRMFNRAIRGQRSSIDQCLRWRANPFPIRCKPCELRHCAGGRSAREFQKIRAILGVIYEDNSSRRNEQESVMLHGIRRCRIGSSSD